MTRTPPPIITRRSDSQMLAAAVDIIEALLDQRAWTLREEADARRLVDDYRMRPR